MRRVFARRGSAALATSTEWMGLTAGAFGQVCCSSPLALGSISISSFRHQRRPASTTTAATNGAVPHPMSDPLASSEPSVLAAAAADDAGTPAATAAECNRFEGSPAAFVELVNACDVLVVNFTARWCKPCQEIAPEWARLRHHFASHGVVAEQQPLSSSSADGSGDSDSNMNGSSSNASSATGKDGDDAAAGATIKVTFIDVDISANDALSALHDIRCVPTYGCYIGGGGRAAGALPPPRPRRPVLPTTATVESAAANGEGSSASTSSVGDEVIGDGSRGLFGTVEGAHLDKVHAMIDAAILAAAEERRAAAEAGGSGR